MIPSGVYRIDLGGGWFYVGSACNLKQRERQHRSDLRRGVHCNQIIERTFNKYGAFTFTVLGRYPVDQILGREQALLDKHCADPKCANIALVVGNPMMGRKHSDATRAAIGAAQIGRKHTAEARANMSAALIGKKKPPFSEAHRAAISAAHMGNKRAPFTEAHRAAMSAAHMGRSHKPSDETKKKMSDAATARWARVREAAAAAL